MFIKTLTGKTIPTDVNKNDFVEDLKQSIEDKEGVFVTQQRLTNCMNGQMEDGHALSEYNIKEHDAIYLVIRSMGGQETYFLLPKLLDPRYNFVYPGIGQDPRSFSRGNRSFTRPYGWKKTALKVLGEYDNDEWLGVSRYDETDSAVKDGQYPTMELRRGLLKQ